VQLEVKPEELELGLDVQHSRPTAAADVPATETAAAVPAAKTPANRLASRAAAADAAALSQTLDIGEHLLRDILLQLSRPGRDPREDLPPPIFKKGVLKLEDLEPGMELTGTVLNVVDFGAFVDIGLHDSGLVHISQVANRFVKDPHEVLAVGDIVTVWVMEIDKSRRRVGLTMIPPGTPKPEKPQRKKPSRRDVAGEAAGRPKRRGSGRKPRKEQRGGGEKPRPKRPLPPITEEMARGEEPLRSFGDLLQFMHRKEDDNSANG
ncbi:MAG: S1 RNA-binding domain-containing protein, partial [Pirellulales bacterium]